ncbi:MAG: tetratricopeptide repeat protein [Magnetococcales bacterium]|nr:tetratricopeptide repeat protein [Magnetococcales bacterium]MBF0323273.1 tetratricopeptide repeat protein [Magnetococcales bacterium]
MIRIVVALAFLLVAPMMAVAGMFDDIREGDKYAQNGRLEEAIDRYTWAIMDAGSLEKGNLTPQVLSTLHRRRGWVYAQKGVYRMALEDLNEALRLNPRDSLALGYRSRVLEKMGLHDQAWSDIREKRRILGRLEGDRSSRQVLTP